MQTIVEKTNSIEAEEKLHRAVVKQEFMINAVSEMTGRGADRYHEDIWFGFYLIMKDISRDMKEVETELEKKRKGTN